MKSLEEAQSLLQGREKLFPPTYPDDETQQRLDPTTSYADRKKLRNTDVAFVKALYVNSHAFKDLAEKVFLLCEKAKKDLEEEKKLEKMNLEEKKLGMEKNLEEEKKLGMETKSIRIPSLATVQKLISRRHQPLFDALTVRIPGSIFGGFWPSYFSPTEVECLKIEGEWTSLKIVYNYPSRSELERNDFKQHAINSFVESIGVEMFDIEDVKSGSTEVYGLVFTKTIIELINLLPPSAFRGKLMTVGVCVGVSLVAHQLLKRPESKMQWAGGGALFGVGGALMYDERDKRRRHDERRDKRRRR